MPPEVAGWRRVTVETAPFAERMQTALGPCCENDMIFVAMSCMSIVKVNSISRLVKTLVASL